MPRLGDTITGLAREIQDLRRRASGRIREGKVAALNPGSGLYRVDIGHGATPFLTDWIPVESLSSGELAIQAEPTMGQLVQVRSESGDLTDAVIALSSFDDSHPRPHGAAGEMRVKVGQADLLVAAGGLTLTVGGVSMLINDSGVAITGGIVTHNGTNVGDTHTHSHGDPAGTTSPPS